MLAAHSGLILLGVPSTVRLPAHHAHEFPCGSCILQFPEATCPWKARGSAFLETCLRKIPLTGRKLRGKVSQHTSIHFFKETKPRLACAHMSVFLSAFLSDCGCLCLSPFVYVSLCLALSVFVYLCLTVHVSVSVSFCLCLLLSLSLSLCLCLSLFVDLCLRLCLRTLCGLGRLRSRFESHCGLVGTGRFLRTANRELDGSGCAVRAPGQSPVLVARVGSCMGIWVVPGQALRWIALP